jgi:hypothetical protein
MWIGYEIAKEYEGVLGQRICYGSGDGKHKIWI